LAELGGAESERFLEFAVVGTASGEASFIRRVSTGYRVSGIDDAYVNNSAIKSKTLQMSCLIDPGTFTGSTPGDPRYLTVAFRRQESASSFDSVSLLSDGPNYMKITQIY